jgi:hypothetical protein
MILFLEILGGIAALAAGIYFGGGTYTQTQEEIEARLGVGKPRKAKRHFMWLDFLKADTKGSDRRRTRNHFQTAVARPKKEADDKDRD